MTTEKHVLDAAVTVYGSSGKTREIPLRQAIDLIRIAPHEWSMTPADAIGWEFEEPRYRARTDVFPASVRRVRYESPWSQASDASIWQYGDRPIKAGEEFESKDWPHPTRFEPLNVSARRVLEFFNVAMKSRLNPSPWVGDHVKLDDGLTGIGQAPTRDAMRKATQRAS